MKKKLAFKDKFWQIETIKNSFTVTFGKTGTKGTTQKRAFVNTFFCLIEAKNLVNQKKGEGYEEVGKSTRKMSSSSRKIASGEKKVPKTTDKKKNKNPPVKFEILEKSFPLFKDVDGKYISIEGGKIIHITPKEVGLFQLKKGKCEKVGAVKFKKEIGTCEFAKYYGNGVLLLPEGTEVLSLWDVKKTPSVIHRMSLPSGWKEAPAYFEDAFYYFGEFKDQEGLLELTLKTKQPRFIEQDDLMSARDCNVYGGRLVFATTDNIIGFHSDANKNIVKEFSVNANLSEPRVEFIGNTSIMLIFDKASWKAALLYYSLDGKPKKLGTIRPNEAANLWKIKDNNLWLVTSLDKKEILNLSHYRWNGKDFILEFECQLSSDGHDLSDITFHVIIEEQSRVEIFGNLEGKGRISWRLDI